MQQRVRDGAPFLWLYRPTLPSSRAQAIQVVHMAHAVARAGRRVTLPVDAPLRTPVPELLRWYGLDPVPCLEVVRLGSRRTLGSFALRLAFARWLAASRGRGVVVSRSKRYAAEALRWAEGRFALVIEAHEVDSRLARERGEDPAPALALERTVLAGAAAVVTNAPGTLDLLRETHPTLPPALALHNGTAARPGPGEGEGVGYVGSLRAWKDVATLAEAARRLGRPVHLVGADPRDPLARELVAASEGWLRIAPPLPPPAAIARMRDFRALVLPVSPGLYGDHLASPLKLWDYLALGARVVAADVPSVRSIAPGARFYRPGDAADLARALEAALTDPRPPPRVRSWDDRAAELLAFLEGR